MAPEVIFATERVSYRGHELPEWARGIRSQYPGDYAATQFHLRFDAAENSMAIHAVAANIVGRAVVPKRDIDRSRSSVVVRLFNAACLGRLFEIGNRRTYNRNFI